MNIPVFADIEAASARLRRHAIRTPLLRSAQLDEITGARVFVKAECLQLTGSFKFRGAFNTASALPQSERKSGLVACSSGNHAQGVAEAARLLGMKSVIVMPSDAPAIKVGAHQALLARKSCSMTAKRRTATPLRKKSWSEPARTSSTRMKIPS